MSGTYTLSYTRIIPAYRRWYKPWTWRNQPTTRQETTNPIPYGARPQTLQWELRDLCGHNALFVTRGKVGDQIITFGERHG